MSVSSGCGFFSAPIRTLPGLSTAVVNVLLRGGITTVGEVLEHSRKDLLKLRNMGKKGICELEEAVKRLGNPILTDGWIIPPKTQEETVALISALVGFASTMDQSKLYPFMYAKPFPFFSEEEAK